MGQPVLSTARRAEPCVVTLIEQQAELRGSQAALIGSDRSLTFDELNRAANRLAFTLQEMLGLATGFVAVCLPPCVDRIIAVLGILKSGRGYVVIDPRLHDQGLRDLVGHADVRCVARLRRGANRKAAVRGRGPSCQRRWRSRGNRRDR